MKILARIIKFTLKPHTNADSLSLAMVQGTDWQCVVRTSDWVGSGNLLKETTPEGNDLYEGIYIHLDALLDPTVQEFSFLASKATKKFPDGRPGHRVKTIRLRGMISQGLVIPIPDSVRHLLLTVPKDAEHVLKTVYPDQDLAQLLMQHYTEADLTSLYICHALKIERYEPPIPVDLRGEMVRSPASFVHYTDIENGKNHPTWLTEGEQIRVTEKLHGTNFRVGMVFDGKETPEYIIGSHTTAKKHDGGTTLYAQMAAKYFPPEKVQKYLRSFSEHMIIFGEIYGHKVQDLNYGCAKNVQEVRIYDVVIDHTYQPWETVQEIADLFGVGTVPLLYRGPYNRELVLKFRDGQSTLPGANHAREGVVVTAEPEARVVDEDGATYRKILKFISDDYLCRSGEKDGH